MPDGIYEAKFSFEGFKTLQFESIQLNKNESLSFEIALQPGEIVMGIVVEESLIDTTSTVLTTRISGEMIRKLPIPKK